MPTTKPSEQNPIPTVVIDFIAAFMRAINTARLYASGHDLLKKQTAQLYTKLKDAIADKDLLYLGFAKDTLFL